jgi:ferredoxin-NADP reductase
MTTQEDIDYEPGHVLALEIEANNTKDDSIFDNPFERPAKTQQDIDKNDGWMRGPYTVTRASSRSFDILIKVTGEKSHRFALAAPGSAIKFGGKFKVPIVDGIKEGVKRVVMVSTGVGVGPCIGAIEKLLNDNDNGNAAMDVELLACYKEEGDVIYVDYLDEMQDKHERFHWKAILSEETGRLSASEENLKNLVSPNKVSSLLEETHYHLIGNGAMVNEFKAGLEKAGVPNDQITVEMYFNHRAEVDMDAVDRIASLVTTSHAQNLAVAKE